MPPCHGGDRGFDSHPDRHYIYEALNKSFFYFIKVKTFIKIDINNMKRKKLLTCLLIIIISVSNSNVVASTAYVPSDEEIAPVSDIRTGDKALSDINIRIFQPFFNEMDETESDVIDLPTDIISDAQCPVAPVKTLQNNYGALIKTIRTYNQPITFENIQSLGPNQIIIFTGHGTWMGTGIHSAILTGKYFNEDDLKDPLYKQDYDEGRIVNDFGNEAITYKYIEKYCPNLDNSFVYLSICEGAYHLDDIDGDQTLVNAFLNKGAKAVFGYTKTTDMRYSNVMVYRIINELAEGNTLGDALTNAKADYGDTCPSAAHSVPLIFPISTASSFKIDTAFNSDAPVSRNYVYDGKEKTGVLSGIGYTLSGDITKKDVGNYSVTATLESGFKWPDDTTDPKIINWSITKADVNENDLIPNNIEIQYDTNNHPLLAIRNCNLGTYYFRMQGESDYSTTIPVATNVGEYHIEWYFVGNENAENKGSSSSPITYTTTIIKGTRPNMEARLDNYYYGRSLPTPYLSEEIEIGTKVEYYYFKAGDYLNHYKWENMTSASLDIGSYYIYAKIEETSNYEYFETFDSIFNVLEYKPDRPYIIPNTRIITK